MSQIDLPDSDVIKRCWIDKTHPKSKIDSAINRSRNSIRKRMAIPSEAVSIRAEDNQLVIVTVEGGFKVFVLVI